MYDEGMKIGEVAWLVTATGCECESVDVCSAFDDGGPLDPAGVGRRTGPPAGDPSVPA